MVRCDTEENMGSLGGWEIVLIIIAILLVFGAKKLPEIGKAIGRGLKEFKKATKDVSDGLSDDEEKKQNGQNVEDNQIENKKDPYKEINDKHENNPYK